MPSCGGGPATTTCGSGAARSLLQLGHKAATDVDLLACTIEANLDDRRFFVAKAIGWALREYARTDPDWVRAYVVAHDGRIAPLSRREALKHLG